MSKSLNNHKDDPDVKLLTNLYLARLNLLKSIVQEANITFDITGNDILEDYKLSSSQEFVFDDINPYNNIIMKNCLGATEDKSLVEDLTIAEGIAKYISVGGLFGPINCAPGAFTGKTGAEIWSMCGLDGATPNSPQVESRLVTVNINGSHVTINSALAQDLMAIAMESKKYGFNFKVGSSYRINSSANGQSRHQYGVAVDINPGGGGNPWFNHHFTDTSWNYHMVGSAPWATKACPYNGVYDPTKCIWSWDHPVVQIFNRHGWGWGGAYGDVMHFSITTYKTAWGLGGK